jgi:hypothetical protein
MMHAKIAAAIVLLVLLVSLGTNYFAKTYKVHYSKWFTHTVNRLVDTAETSNNRGAQDQDPLMALQDYTTALTIIDTLVKIMPAEELGHMCNLNVNAFLGIVDSRRQKTLAELTQVCKF